MPPRPYSDNPFLPDMSNIELEPCTHCNGGGIHGDGRICSYCDGEGNIEVDLGDADCDTCDSHHNKNQGCHEGFSFDKFMDQILIKESSTRRRDAKKEELSPQRRLARRVMEHPQGRTRIGGSR